MPQLSRVLAPAARVSVVSAVAHMTQQQVRQCLVELRILAPTRTGDRDRKRRVFSTLLLCLAGRQRVPWPRALPFRVQQGALLRGPRVDIAAARRATMFKKLFGAKPGATGAPGSSSAANQTINAMQGLAEREEQLEKKKLLLEKRINDEMEKAREFTRQKKKSQALMCLKKKKMYEQQLERMDALISRVLEQRNMLEEQQTTIGVLGAMQDAAKAQKKTMQARTRLACRRRMHALPTAHWGCHIPLSSPTLACSKPRHSLMHLTLCQLRL